MNNLDLGIIDHMWDVSLHPFEEYIDFWCTSPQGHNNGWYRALIAWDGLIMQEKRMLADGNYDPHPETNRPNMRIVIEQVPAEHEKVIQVLKQAYRL